MFRSMQRSFVDGNGEEREALTASIGGGVVSLFYHNLRVFISLSKMKVF